MPVTGFLDTIDTYVQKYVVPQVVDQVFKHSPLLAYMKKNNVELFPGGSAIQENLRYAGMKGKFYSKGDSFDVTQRQTNTGATYYPKTAEVNVTEFLEDLNIYVKGPQAPFKLVDDHLQNAADTMAAYIAIALYQNGIRAGYTQMINGLAEIISDGSQNSWDGQTYTALGTLARDGTGPIGNALKGLVVPIAGAISYGALETSFRKVTIGSEMPNLGVTTNLGMSYIVQKFQPQQRVEGNDPNIGFNGMKFNSAMLIQDQYCPGTAISASTDPIVTDFMSNQGLVYPTMSAETFFWLNTKFWKFWLVNDPLYGFGFTGFKRAQDNTTVSGQYLYAGNVTCSSPRLQAQLTGITG